MKPQVARAMDEVLAVQPVAALYVQPRGIYAGRPGVDPWCEVRDARTYAGTDPVVAHPPCGSWGAYAKLSPESRSKGPLLGDDAGTFAAALDSVRRTGGVLEHPKGSKAWARYGLPKPMAAGWSREMFGPGWVAEVEQGHYGHPARKPTWLYYVGRQPPPELIWGPSQAEGAVERMSKTARAATPPAFAELLIEMARRSK